MRTHTKIYLKSLGYDLNDPSQFIQSELSPKKSNDLHHIISRGKGGECRIENLMAVTREEHDIYGDKKEWMYFLLIKHYAFLIEKKVKFSKKWFEQMFEKYKEIHAY